MCNAPRMKKPLSLAIAALLLACGQAPETAGTASVVPTVHEVAISEGTPVTIADLSISGMTCEMMCGGAIKDAMAKLPGVTGTEITFTEGETADHAVVTYDPARVSDAELVKAVQALHEGQYKVLAVDITKQVKGTAQGDAAPAKAQEEGVSASALPEVSVPTLLGLLARLVRL